MYYEGRPQQSNFIADYRMFRKRVRPQLPFETWQIKAVAPQMLRVLYLDYDFETPFPDKTVNLVVRYHTMMRASDCDRGSKVNV